MTSRDPFAALVLVGVDHRTATRIELDERRAALPSTRAGVLVLDGPDHLVVCAAGGDLAPFAAAFAPVGPSTPWTLTGRDAVGRLFRVAAGLDGRWPGDAAPLRALRRARADAAAIEAVPPTLARLAVAAVAAAERARAVGGLDAVWRRSIETAVDRGLADAAAAGDAARVLVVGGGEAATVAVARLRAASARPSFLGGDGGGRLRLVAGPSARVEPHALDERHPPALVVWGAVGSAERDAVLAVWPAWHETVLVDLSPCADGIRALGAPGLAGDVEPASALAVLRAEAAVAARAAELVAAAGVASEAPARSARRARIEEVCVEELAAGVPGSVASAAHVHALARSIARRLVPAVAGERAVLER